MMACTFGERIKELIFDKHITTKTLSEALDISIAKIYNWQRNEYAPGLNTLLELSEYFEVTLEYLSGRTDENHYSKPNSPVPFNVRLQEIIHKTGLSNNAFGNQYNINRSTIQHWVNAERVPLLDSLIRLADFLDISLDYLAGLE